MTSLFPHLPAASAQPDTALVTSAIARLRTECESATNSSTRALLLHEIGVLEERLGDEASGARDQLAAVNADPEFREPLERLIAIIERRKSYKNLGKLLERLVRVSDLPEERARAELDYAFFLWDHEQDLPAARAAFERALAHTPNDSAIWLALEVLAGKIRDPELRDRALAQRAELATNPLWRALLLIDVAELRVESKDFDGAERALDAAIEVDGSATFLALCSLERLGREAERVDVTVRALTQQAALIVTSLHDPVAADARGVPNYRRNAAYAADAFLQASELRRKQGDLSASAALLDQALERLPQEPALLYTRLHTAEMLGDTATAGRLAAVELQRGLTGELAAARWLRIAEARASDEQAAAALDAVQKALAEDKANIVARALELDFLAGSQDAQSLAAAIETCADQLPTDEARARLYLVSADIWAREVRDSQGARAALSQAGMFGAQPRSVARLARMLAALTLDFAWYEEATRRLIAQGSEEGEQVSLWFELARLRALRGDRNAALQSLEGIANAPGGSWLGNVLIAYSQNLLPQESETAAIRRSSMPAGVTPVDALRVLIEREADPGAQRALSLIFVLRALLRDDTQAALEKLEELSKGDASDVISAAALASLQSARENPQAAAAALARSAKELDDPPLAAALWLEAGIRYWQAGERKTAVDCFSEASELCPPAGGYLLSWALRAADPNSIEARRRALEAAESSDPALSALERFSLEVGRGGQSDAADGALSRFESDAPREIALAGNIARALWAGEDPHFDKRRTALDSIAAQSSACAGLARAAAYQLELSRPENLGTGALLEAAERWANADGSPAAALEWLAASVASENLDSELNARRALATRVPEPMATMIAGSANMIAHLAGVETSAPLESDDASARLSNLELAPPGSDPRRRARALLSLSGVLGEEADPTLTALAGYNQLAAGDIDGAFESFQRVVEAYPEEIIGWEGMRIAAETRGDRKVVAEACAALGDAVSDARVGSENWEKAALILLDELGDSERGEFALSRAVDRDVRRHDAFDRLFRLVRSRKEGPKLLELISRRLEVADDPEEIAKLFWERARVLREAGDRDGALSALENVRMLEPEHVGALALSGEIYLRQQRFEEAAENLARLATLAAAPAQQRLMSGVAAVDVYENKLNNLQSALDVLIALYRSGLSTQPVRERLARIAAKRESWELATEVLEKLMSERDTSTGRIEAARLAMVIYRDRMRRPQAAEAAVSKLLEEAPDDPEALDMALSGSIPKTASRHLVARAHTKLVATLLREPLDIDRVERLSRVASFMQNAPLRQAALGAVITLGMLTPEIEEELRQLDDRVAHVPQIAITDEALPNLADPDDTGPVPELMRIMATTIAAALGPSLAGYGVTKKERVEARLGLPVRNEVAAWAGALGIGEFELYVGGREPEAVVAIPGEIPALIIGSRITAPLSPAHRQAVARELFALRRGTTILRHREAADITALVVAACRVVEVDIPTPPFALLAEFQRQLGREMTRRVRKILPPVAAQVLRSGQNVGAWYTAATSSLDRLAAIAAGDVSWVLGQSGSRGRVGSSREAQARARRLLSFVLSPVYLALRDQLGMGVR